MSKTLPARALALAALAALAAGCTDQTATAPDTEVTPSSAFAGRTGARLKRSGNILDQMNVRLRRLEADYLVASMAYITSPTSGQIGQEVFASDVGPRKGPYHFAPQITVIPGGLTWAVDMVDGAATGGLAPAQTSASIDAAMAVWGSQTCSELSLTRVDAGGDVGWVQAFLGLGGSFTPVAEVTHAGWLPSGFFDAISPDGQGGSYILGVTFTFVWLDEDDNLVDVNHDGLADAAFREIYYNNAFPWSDQPQAWTDPFVDAQTVVLHEAGHGLSQNHFGRVFFDAFGVGIQHLHFAPRAVMNATYWETQRTLLGNDLSAHCSLWGGWN